MLKLSVTAVPDAWARGGRLDLSFIRYSWCKAFGRGLLLDCEALRSRQCRRALRQRYSVWQCRLLTNCVCEKPGANGKCSHPLRDDFGSIAVIAPVLLQSPESRKLFSCRCACAPSRASDSGS